MKHFLYSKKYCSKDN